MKKILFIIMFLGLFSFGAMEVSAESLFSLNATQNGFIEPKPLYGSVRARNVGDVVTIILEEAPTLTDKGIYETQKSSSLLENFSTAINEIFKTHLKGALNDTNGSLSVSGGTNVQRQLSMKDQVAAQVVQLLPNGNLLVQGKKTLVSGNERVDLLISGVVDPRWINQSGEIYSTQVANLQFAMSGTGTVSRGQNEGFLNRFIRQVF